MRLSIVREHGLDWVLTECLFGQVKPYGLEFYKGGLWDWTVYCEAGRILGQGFSRKWVLCDSFDK